MLKYYTPVMLLQFKRLRLITLGEKQNKTKMFDNMFLILFRKAGMIFGSMKKA